MFTGRLLKHNFRGRMRCIREDEVAVFERLKMNDKLPHLGKVGGANLSKRARFCAKHATILHETMQA